jgi:putative aminopeptidase FrvX
MARRCAHSPCEVAKLADFEGAARLLTALLRELTGREVQELGAPTRV